MIEELTPEEAARQEAGRLLFARPAEFLKGVVALDGLPDADRTECAFAGRSNVGKSSLINALVSQKGLARASNTPGRTQEINYFTLTEALYLVDLPGYGFAQAPKSVVERWTRLTRDFLRGRVTLKRVYLLVDSRHGVKANDEAIMAMLDEAAVSYQVVLTKIDKLKSGQAEQRIAQTLQAIAKRPAAFPRISATSSEKGLGLAALRADIAELIAHR